MLCLNHPLSSQLRRCQEESSGRRKTTGQVWISVRSKTCSGDNTQPTYTLPSFRAPVWPLSSEDRARSPPRGRCKQPPSHLLCSPKLLHGTWQDTDTAAEARAGPAKGSTQTAQLLGSSRIPSALIHSTQVQAPGNSCAGAVCPITPAQNPQNSGELRMFHTGQQTPISKKGLLKLLMQLIKQGQSSCQGNKQG